MIRYVARFLLAMCLVAGAPGAAGAVEFQVDSTADAPDAFLDGSCLSSAGACTLRAAIQEANATVDADVILVPAGKYTLKLVGPFEEDAGTGDLDIVNDLTINGAGAGSTIIVGKKDRIFDVFAPAVVTLSGLTVTKGKLGKGKQTGTDLQGAGIYNGGTLALDDVVVSKNKTSDDGGGIHNVGTLSGNDVTITGNKARLDGAGINHVGDDLSLTNATFSKNKAGDEGGGIEIIDAPTLLTNVTFSGNKAKGPGGGVNIEGEVVDTTIRSATFSGNKSKQFGGGIGIQTGLPTLVNTILQKNKPENCNTAVDSDGGNLETLVQCGFPGESSGIKKLGLASLKSNGGPTATHALQEGSPAIDAGVDALCLPADQRGTERMDVEGVGASLCDSGAFEFVP